MVCPVKSDLQDGDWEYIIYEINMNYTIDSLRQGYAEMRKKQSNYVSNDVLRAAGYSEEDIANRLE